LLAFPLPIADIEVDSASFFAIVVVAAVAAVTVAAVPKRFAPPVVVLELVLGIVIGPEILDIAKTDAFVDFFSNLGLGMLFFFAGYEIDFDRIKGVPMKLGALGWALSVALAYGIGGILAAAGVIVSFLYTGSAMATTAIGTLIPILRDNNELKTRFGTYLLAAGGAGEFGPILLVTLVLSTTNPLHEALILLAFVALALTDKGELADDPEVDLVGVPEKNKNGEVIADEVFDLIVSTVENLPRARRRDPDAVAESVRRAVRSEINDQWGKKPLCVVHVLMV